MVNFVRENRYLVIKRTDLEQAKRVLTADEVIAIDVLIEAVEVVRFARQKETLECVVVESDWRCYDEVWAMVEAEHVINQSRKASTDDWNERYKSLSTEQQAEARRQFEQFMLELTKEQ